MQRVNTLMQSFKYVNKLEFATEEIEEGTLQYDMNTNGPKIELWPTPIFQ